ncbi:dynactin subunit 3 isoform X1 [Octodon degus]|uniref:Dynactin subunit 3 isoform X1 n=1 Tax=Octodon degus TaxID=10160 RepID=A0A6P6EIP6_OCTDE|nr:dynactin subunit 3 isoform X1 [Octodon degus]
MAALTDVQRLQARVEELERWVYGPGGARGSRKVADGLVKVQVALGNIASKRERVKILYKKIEDLIKYLDPEYIDRIALSDASKLQFILAEEQFILSQVALLEQVNALVPMLDSASIKAVPEHAARLQHLAQIHIQQQDQCMEITEESKALLEEYNKIVSFLRTLTVRAVGRATLPARGCQASKASRRVTATPHPRAARLLGSVPICQGKESFVFIGFRDHLSALQWGSKVRGLVTWKL